MKPDEWKRHVYSVRWSEPDQQWLGKCDPPFPSLSHLADTIKEAFVGITDLVDAVEDDLLLDTSENTE
jgi:hypothetical protein